MNPRDLNKILTCSFQPGTPKNGEIPNMNHRTIGHGVKSTLKSMTVKCVWLSLAALEVAVDLWFGPLDFDPSA